MIGWYVGGDRISSAFVGQSDTEGDAGGGMVAGNFSDHLEVVGIDISCTWLGDLQDVARYSENGRDRARVRVVF